MFVFMAIVMPMLLFVPSVSTFAAIPAPAPAPAPTLTWTVAAAAFVPTLSVSIWTVAATSALTSFYLPIWRVAAASGTLFLRLQHASMISIL